jgi:hypothetical protein
MIFKDGVPMRKVAGEDIVEAFVMETEKLLAEIGLKNSSTDNLPNSTTASADDLELVSTK